MVVEIAPLNPQELVILLVAVLGILPMLIYYRSLSN